MTRKLHGYEMEFKAKALKVNPKPKGFKAKNFLRKTFASKGLHFPSYLVLNHATNVISRQEFLPSIGVKYTDKKTGFFCQTQVWTFWQPCVNPQKTAG
jgi:hypothetical protein